jgi:hypothetical protein
VVHDEQVPGLRTEIGGARVDACTFFNPSFSFPPFLFLHLVVLLILAKEVFKMMDYANTVNDRDKYEMRSIKTYEEVEEEYKQKVLNSVAYDKNAAAAEANM